MWMSFKCANMNNNYMAYDVNNVIIIIILFFEYS